MWLSLFKIKDLLAAMRLNAIDVINPGELLI